MILLVAAGTVLGGLEVAGLEENDGGGSGEGERVRGSGSGVV